MLLKKIIIISSFLFLPLVSLAEEPPTVTNKTSPLLGKLQTVATDAGYVESDENGVLNIVGTLINTVLALLGTVFIILMLVAGYNWMTASGDEEKITKAKDTIRAAIIGLIIVVGAFAIWSFINTNLIGSGDITPTQ